MDSTYIASVIAVVALVTMALRFLPFLIFSGKKETPAFMLYLGKVLPYAIMAMLVVYCMKSVTLLRSPFGIPEFAAGIITALLHIWKRNTLISIIGGTAAYMLLIQFVFA